MVIYLVRWEKIVTLFGEFSVKAFSCIRNMDSLCNR